MKRHIFISHKNNDLSNTASEVIGEELQNHGFSIFFDKISLEAGMNWNQEIRDNLDKSDVVIIVIDSETVESDWVQREIDTARAKSISIFPIIVETFSDVKPAFERFDIEETQAFHFKMERQRSDLKKTFDKIKERVEALALQTDAAQEQAYAIWQQRRIAKHPRKTVGSREILHTFRHSKAGDINFHITAGDASQTRNFDVLVNTENNYMQMARFFETSTLSYAIRTNGAYIHDGVRLREDTIQDQLYLYASDIGGLPALDTQVLVTGAGHKRSNIRMFTDYQYILHACAVRVSLADKSVTPIEPISKIMVNCLRKIADVDRENGGIIFESGHVLIEPRDDYQPLTSVLFPVFGTGYGGKDLSTAIQQMVISFKREVPESIENFQLSIKDVGISILFEENVAIAVDHFQTQGFEAV